MKLSRKKFVLFAVAAMGLSIGAMLLALVAADLLLHKRAERSAGLNRHGYRGPVVGRKRPGELRVVVLGGSTVFGYGVAWNESVPASLEPKLQARLGPAISVVNLGYNSEGAYAFVPNLEDYAYLDYDVIVLYEGYNDLMGDGARNTLVYRRNSAVFRLTGYFPILPLYLDEKIMMLRAGNNLGAAYEAGKGSTVFRPNLAQRTSATALETVRAMANALDAQLSKVAGNRHAAVTEVSAAGCADPWVHYCESVAAAVRFGRARGDAVVVASQPTLLLDHARMVHAQQQAMLKAMVQHQFDGDRGVVWADLSNAVDLKAPNVTFDAMHLNPQANAAVAAALVEPIVSAIAGAGLRN